MPKNKKPYQYNCVDKSIFLPVFKKYWVEYFYKLVPDWLTANWITLMSSLAMWIMLIMSFNPSWVTTTVLALISAFLIHFYVVGDHLDGMQAKNTKTSSPLGEFLDHYFDVYNSAISIAACFGLLQVQFDFPALYFFLLWGSYVAFGATMMEEKERGELYFGPIGSLEGVFILIAFYISCAIPEVLAFWHQPLWNGYANYWAIVLVTGLGFGATVLDILFRLGYSPRQFNLFLVASFVLTLSLVYLPNIFITGWFILAFYSGDYIGRMMDSYLSDTPHPYPDLVGTVLIVVLALQTWMQFLNTEMQGFLIYGILGYCFLKAIHSFSGVFKNHKEHWNWLNPEVN